MPDWAKESPLLGQIWLEIDEFMTRIKTMGYDPEKAKLKVMNLIQDYPSMTWDNARAYVLTELALGNKEFIDAS